MNNKDNLQNAFKKAFEDHQEPLFQAQWDRLESSLANKKPKRRFFPWFIITILVSIASIGAGYWYAISQKNNKNNNELISQNSTLENNSTNSIDLNKNNSNNLNNHNLNNEQKLNIDSQSKKNVKKSFQKSFEAKKDDKLKNHKKSKKEDPIPSNSETPSNINNPEPNLPIVDNDYYQLQLIGLKKTKVNLKFEEFETLKTNPIVKNCFKTEKFAIGFSTGYSRAFYSNISFSNPNKTHVDAKSVFKEKNKNTSSIFAQLFADFSLSKRIKLSLNSGVQYWEIISKENIKYYHTNIPFRNIDGSIIGYINKQKDSSQVFENNSINKTNIISIPFGLSYFKPINCKSELQIKGGIIFNQSISAKGVTFAIDNTENVNFSETINKKMTLGFLTGMTYYRNINKNIWLGIGLQYQQNKMSFKELYNDVNSKLNTISISFNIKRKF
jgi:hypothetical protein